MKKGDEEKVPDRITYSQSVRVNTGNYEHKDIFISFSTDIKDKETPDKALLRAKKFVQASSKKVERRVRATSEEFVDFNTMRKLI